MSDIEIRSLAELKRTIQVGTRLRVLDHWQEKYRGTERTVVKTQGNGFYFTMVGSDKRYWSAYEKSSNMAFDGSAAYTVTAADGAKGWTLEVLDG